MITKSYNEPTISKVLVFLLTNLDKRKNYIYGIVKGLGISYGFIHNMVQFLLKDKLIKEVKITKSKLKKYYDLTKKGKELSEYFREINKILK